MIKDKDFKNYFMLPQEVNGIGKIYPIKIEDYVEFKESANKYLLMGRKYLTNIFKYPKTEPILDFYVKNALIIDAIKDSQENNLELEEMLKNNEMVKYSIDELCSMFKKTLKQEVVFELLGFIDDVIDYRFKIGDKKYFITKFNFEEYREVVMNQNLLYEPLTSPSPKGNEVIQNAIRVLSKNGSEQSLISIIATVSVYKGVEDKELANYTYFRLMYDFETINKINNNIFQALFMSQGSKEAEIKHLGERVDIDKNPFDGLLRRNGDNQLTKKLQSG